MFEAPHKGLWNIVSSDKLVQQPLIKTYQMGMTDFYQTETQTNISTSDSDAS